MYCLKPGTSVGCFAVKENVPGDPSGGHTYYYNEKFENYIDEIKKAGFYSIELVLCDLWNQSGVDQAMPSVYRAIDVVKNSGVKINSVHMPFGGGVDFNFASPSEDLRKLAISNAIKICEYFKDDMPSYFNVHPGVYKPDVDDKEVCFKQLIKSMCEIDKLTNAKIVVENMTNKGLLYSSEEARRFLDNCPADMLVDLNHMLFESPENYLRTVGGRLKGIHVSDRDAEKECHYLPGDGILDWQSIIKTLDEINFNGVFNYEVSMRLGYTYNDVINIHKELFDNYNK